MPLSTSQIPALRKIAELASGEQPPTLKMELILGAVREALGLEALAAVAEWSSADGARVWCSAGNVSTLDIPLIKRTALAEPQSTGASGFHVIPIPSANDFRAALVADGKFDGDEAAPLLEVATAYLSVLIHNAELAEELDNSNSRAHGRIEEIAALYEVGQAMDSTDVKRVLDMIVEKAAAVMDAQACSLMLLDPADNTLVIEASHGLTDDIIKGARIKFGQGIAGRVAETGQPMLITDVAADPRFTKRVKPRPGISGSMCVPLMDDHGTVSGVLSIRRHDPKPPFREDDLQLFCVFGQHAALALSNAQLYSRLHRKVAEMSRISEVLHAINSTLDLDHVLNQIVESITEVVGFDRCCVYLLDSRTSEFVAGARKGYGPTDRIVDRVKQDEGIIGLAAQEQIPIFSQSSPVGTAGSWDAGEFLAAPIVVRGEAIGVVTVDNSRQQRPIEPENIELLATFVSQAGIAVENARLYEAMEEKYAELNILYEHSRNLSAAYGLDKTADILVQTAYKAVPCDGAGLLLLDTRGGRMGMQSGCGVMVHSATSIAELADNRVAVDYVREFKSPVLIPPDAPERTGSPGAKLLNTLAPGGAALMLAPLVAEDETIGVLVMCRARPDEFESADFKLVSIIASHAATVVKNAISYEQKMRQRTLELTALYEFSKKISSASNLEEALDSILAIVADLVDYDESFIYGIDSENGTASVMASRFRKEPKELPPDEPLDSPTVMNWAIRERMAVVSPNVSIDPRFKDSWTSRPNVKSLMSIPLIVQDEVVGILSVHSPSLNKYSDEDVRVLSIIASQGAAIYKELEALTALTSYTDNILSSIAAGVATLDSNGVLLTWNTAAENIVGVEAPDIVAMHFEDVLDRLMLSEEDKDTLRQAIAHVSETGETYQAYKISFHPRDSEGRYMNLSVSQLLNSTGEQLGLVIIFEDITREIKMEDDFRRMGELAAVGQLAASIAHELRNPLSSIKGAAQFLQKEFEHEASIVEFLGIIIEEVNGLNKLTTEFLDFARPMQLELKPTSVNKVVEKTLQLMSVHITDHNTAVREALDPNVPEIQADEQQLDQVLKNIIINALQAMPEGGRLSLETGPTPAGGAYISVSDTGVGIPPDKIERIFQPFFTTKTKGTGLGLSVVHRIVENHGGRIEVISEPGSGSAFKIILPRLGAHAHSAASTDTMMERRMPGDLRNKD